MTLRLPLLLATLVAVALIAPATSSARVPFGFVGVMADGPIAAPGFDVTSETRLMVRSGVESTRLVFHWSDAQPYGDFATVPTAQRWRFRDVRGVPTTFDHFDPLVAAAAARRLRVLAVITTAPGWAAKHPGDFASPPAGTASYAAFARAVVERYGPRGSFWSENPAIPRNPIRIWQPWNEPSLRTSWSDRDWAAPYVALLRAARRSIRASDPRAHVVLAGLSNYSWRALARVYRVRGARKLFDEVALHPYTRDPDGLLTIVRRARRVMARNGDAPKRIAITEFGWPSALGKAEGFGIETTERGQASRAAAALRSLARHRKRLRISSLYWYTWIGREQGSPSIWPYSGLRRLEPDGSVRSKPALASFRRTSLRLEGCRRKSRVATRCAVR